MGWISRSKEPSRQLPGQAHDSKRGGEGIETAELPPPSDVKSLPRFGIQIPDSELPFLVGDMVLKHQDAESGGLWVVIDNVVYDCTNFIYEHPGGEEVIRSFAGQECSWQFWRFHGKEQLEEFGKPLRVGRTIDMKNGFEIRPRYVGLRGLSSADEW